MFIVTNASTLLAQGFWLFYFWLSYFNKIRSVITLTVQAIHYIIWFRSTWNLMQYDSHKVRLEIMCKLNKITFLNIYSFFHLILYIYSLWVS